MSEFKGLPLTPLAYEGGCYHGQESYPPGKCPHGANGIHPTPPRNYRAELVDCIERIRDEFNELIDIIEQWE